MTERSNTRNQGFLPQKYNSGSSAGIPKQAGSSQETLVCPALHLYPLNDTFVPKQINLAPASSNNRIKIGRYSNNKTVPSPVNGYFDSKVLSRAHAEVWCENDKVFIKDIKSSNGTFINGTRLSPESQESEPFELHSEDVVDFGIDILTDDNKDILHRRVACRVFLVISPDDALKLRNDFSSLYRGGVHGGTLGNAGLCPGAEGGFRRGKPNINLDQVLGRIQIELHKSNMVGSELRTLSTAIEQIHNTLGGGVVPVQDAPHQELVPPKTDGLRESSVPTTEKESMDANTLANLESQLANAQTLLANHMEKIKELEATLAGYEHVKDEVSALKAEITQTKLELSNTHSLQGVARSPDRLLNSVREVSDGFNDAASTSSTDTVVPVSTGNNSDAERVAEVTKESAPMFSQRFLSGSENFASSSLLPDVLARIERLEKTFLEQGQQQQQQKQMQRKNDTFVLTNSDESFLQEWQQCFERKWEQQRNEWDKTHQKINDSIASLNSQQAYQTKKVSPSSEPINPEIVLQDKKISKHAPDSLFQDFKLVLVIVSSLLVSSLITLYLSKRS